MIMIGESLLNEISSMVIFNIINEFAKEDQADVKWHWSILGTFAWKYVLNFVASITIGLLWGICLKNLSKK